MKATLYKGFSFKKAIDYFVIVISRLLALGIAKTVFRLHVEGTKFIPRTGPAILAANHVSFIDPIIIAAAVPRPLHFMAKEELFRFRLFAWLLRRYHVFPVSRHRIDLQAVKRAIFLLEQGEIVVIFPEGTRGDGVTLRPAKPGIGLIAARTGVPVIPALHQGTERALPRGAWFLRPHRITVKFGAPLRYAEARADGRQEHVVAFSQAIMGRIAALKGQSEGATDYRAIGLTSGET